MYKISPNILLEVSKDGMNGYITLLNDKKIDESESKEDNNHLSKKNQ